MTILEGSTFCICDEIGDLDGRTSGFFSEDTRFLSRLELRVNGARPLLLSSGTRSPIPPRPGRRHGPPERRC